MSRSVLIIDDEVSIRESLTGALEDEGIKTFSVEDGRKGIDFLKNQGVDVVLLDIWMRPPDGIETLTLIKQSWPAQIVVMMSGHGTIETAVKATKLGAYDFIEKPLSLEKLLVTLQNSFKARDLTQENMALRKQVRKKRALIGNAPAIIQIKELIQRVAPTTGSVLITGENGTGKEIIARNIHTLSKSYSKQFIEVNCAAIPEELIESELFGHEKGAFTGAIQRKKGKFDLADGGTLFLDEIGDMSLKTQAKILRILQEKKFERVGGSETISVDVRVIAATNKDLKTEIKKGNFREDLFYRLNVVPIVVPPLRDRQGDIGVLAQYFLEEFSTTNQKKGRELPQDSLKVLALYSWPGNVRELRNLMERIVILTPEEEDGKPIMPADLLNQLQEDQFLEIEEQITEGQDNESTASKNLREARREFEREFILRILREQNWNISKTASVLGVERSHLHRKIKLYGIETETTS